jgi:hypothetical protein
LGLLPCHVDLELLKPDWAGLANLHFETKDGRTYDVDVYDLNREPIGAFSSPPCQEYFRGGNSKKVNAAIRRAYTECQKGKKPTK